MRRITNERKDTIFYFLFIDFFLIERTLHHLICFMVDVDFGISPSRLLPGHKRLLCLIRKEEQSLCLDQ